MWDPFSEFETTTLRNGLTVYAAHWPGRPWQHMGFIIHSGAKDDRIGREGTAHFMEHMVSENSGSSNKDMTEYFRSHGGGAMFGMTSFSSTYYSFMIGTDELENAIALFGDMLVNAKLERHVERERKVIVGEFHSRHNPPYLFELLLRKNRMLLPGSWFSRMTLPLGTLETIAAITEEDLQSYYDLHYVPGNMSVVCVGGMPLSELVPLLERSPFGSAKSGGAIARTAPFRHTPKPPETRYIFETRDVSPSETGRYLSAAVFPSGTSRVALKMFARVLEPILFEELRADRSWTYHAGVELLPHSDFMEMSIGTDELSPDAFEEVMDVVDRCIERAATDTVGLSHVQHSVCSTIALADLSGEQLLEEATNMLMEERRIITAAESIEAHRAVTPAHMLALGEQLAGDRRWSLLMRP